MLNPEYKVMIGGELIDAPKLGKLLFDTRVERRDVIQWNPFNHFDDEDTDTKTEPNKYQNKDLQVIAVDLHFVNTWNGLIKIVFTYRLKMYSNSGDA